MPAGERARKRRAAQAASSVARPARRLRAGNTTMRLPAFRFLFILRVILPENRNCTFRDHALPGANSKSVVSFAKQI